MSDFIDHLQHRIEETKRRLQDANERMQQAMADGQMLTADLQGYERTLAAEMRGQGVTDVSPKSATQGELPLNAGSCNGAASAITEVSKAEFARQFIKNHAAGGATPADLYKGFQDAAIPIGKAYIYALIQRLQKQRAIRSRRNKWYPVPESEREGAQGEGRIQ